MKQAPDSDLGGAAIMRALEAKCLNSGRIDFKDHSKVKTYKMCEQRYQCEQ